MRDGALRSIFFQRDYSKVRHFSEFRRLHSALAQRLTCQSVEVSEIRKITRNYSATQKCKRLDLTLDTPFSQSSR